MTDLATTLLDVVHTPAVPEDAPHEVRERVARRNIVDQGGICPCGASLHLPRRIARLILRDIGRNQQRPYRVPVPHAARCPAVGHVTTFAAGGTL